MESVLDERGGFLAEGREFEYNKVGEGLGGTWKKGEESSSPDSGCSDSVSDEEVRVRCSW